MKTFQILPLLRGTTRSPLLLTRLGVSLCPIKALERRGGSVLTKAIKVPKVEFLVFNVLTELSDQSKAAFYARKDSTQASSSPRLDEGRARRR